jgi:hypothetical protein
VSNPTAPNNIKPLKYSTLQTSDLIDLPVYYKTADTNSYERNEALTKRNQWVEPKLANNQPTRLMSATIMIPSHSFRYAMSSFIPSNLNNGIKASAVLIDILT